MLMGCYLLLDHQCASQESRLCHGNTRLRHGNTKLRMLDGRDMCSCLETAHEKWSQKSDQRQERCDCCHMHLLTDRSLHHCATHSCCSIDSILAGS